MRAVKTVLAVVRAWPVFLTDWVEIIPSRFHCGILTKAYGPMGHSWLCPSCDDEELEEYVAS